MLKKGILCSLILLLYGSCCYFLFYNTKAQTVTIHQDKIIHNQDTSYGWIKIPRIHLEQELFSKDREENNIGEHVTILKESTLEEKPYSRIILAAHSGDAPNSYFNDLEKLKMDDFIELEIEHKKATYQIIQSYLEAKSGTIHLKSYQESILVLTTCSVKEPGKQFILIAKKIEG